MKWLLTACAAGPEGVEGPTHALLELDATEVALLHGRFNKVTALVQDIDCYHVEMRAPGVLTFFRASADKFPVKVCRDLKRNGYARVDAAAFKGEWVQTSPRLLGVLIDPWSTECDSIEITSGARKEILVRFRALSRGDDTNVMTVELLPASVFLGE